MPNETRGTLDVRLEKYRQRFKTHEFFKKMKKERILNMNTIKVIDITALYEDLTLHLHVSLEKVYNGFCNEIMIKCRERIIRIFVTKSNYVFQTYNDLYTVTLDFYTEESEYKVINNSLIYTYKMNLYEYYYEDNFEISLPNHSIINIQKGVSEYAETGLLRNRPIGNKTIRGQLYVRFMLEHDKPHNDHKDLMKMIFHK
jgi:hypothetical protein|tara:strand:- start:6050 stop:6649 length:600 start_codon:yes stop_codon:yes gene_type:complete